MIKRELPEIRKGGTQMDRLEAMSVIIAVTETGSISAASCRLKSPVATVSRKVAELEFAPQSPTFSTHLAADDVDRCRTVLHRCLQAHH